MLCLNAYHLINEVCESTEKLINDKIGLQKHINTFIKVCIHKYIPTNQVIKQHE